MLRHFWRLYCPSAYTVAEMSGSICPAIGRFSFAAHFGELQYDEGTTRAFEPPREFWFTAYAFADNSQEEFERKRAELIAEAPELLHEGKNYVAKAEIKKKSNEEMEWFSLSSSNITLTGRAVCTIIFVDPNDREWAIRTWKSLQPPKPKPA